MSTALFNIHYVDRTNLDVGLAAQVGCGHSGIGQNGGRQSGQDLAVDVPYRVHSIIVVGATHMRHPGAYGLIEAQVSLAWAPQIL